MSAAAEPFLGGADGVFAFDEPLPAGIDRVALLGGKGAGLVEMTQDLGLPVPPGFVISTRLCLDYLAGGWPAGLDDAIAAHLDALGQRLGRRFGDPSAPFLVSVRSGAPVSMPGMMDTVLNVGITPDVRDAIAASTGNPAFAADTWLRFHRMFGEIVLDLPKADLASPVPPTSAAEAIAEADRIRRLAAARGAPFPISPLDQVRAAVEAVFRSWNCDRARIFRAHESIPDDLGTAVTVQAMVFGNLDDRSGTGVVFSRDPATGRNEPYGDYLPRAQGEDVVAGTHAVHGLDRLHEQLPAVDGELRAMLHHLESHYRDMCDVEFTVSEGRLYILQTRVGRRSPLATVRIAVDMANDPDFPLSREEAVSRVSADTIHRLSATGGILAGARPIASGLAASPGVGAGALCCDSARAGELAADGHAIVLARQETSPEDVQGMVGAAAIVTTLGGVASHAAVVARGWAIPAVVSLRGAEFVPGGLRIGDRVIVEGEMVTVCGTSGSLYLGDCRTHSSEDVPEVRVLREWAAEMETIEAAPEGAAGREVSLFDLARTIQLKGLCTVERAAAALETTPEMVEAAIGGSPALFKETARGFAISAEGRAWVAAQLESERGSGDSAGLETAYADFLPLNLRFKQVVTSWQLTPEDDPERVPAMVAAVKAIHADFQPILELSARCFPRLSAYAARFDHALAVLVGGDHSMLASPLKDSYHTLWFEYHEELIALSGRDRATEESENH